VIKTRIEFPFWLIPLQNNRIRLRDRANKVKIFRHLSRSRGTGGPVLFKAAVGAEVGENVPGGTNVWVGIKKGAATLRSGYAENRSPLSAVAPTMV
jgi:hypothetical protein